MSVLVLDNRRIFLSNMKRYELCSNKLYHRNNKEEERFLFIWLLNQDELWSEYSFNYLSIQMFDGESYKFVSDKRLSNIMKKMANYFEQRGIGSEVEERILEEDAYLKKAFESYKKIKGNFIFVNEDILDTVNKIDNAFGTI